MELILAKRYDDGKEETVAEHMRCTAGVAFDQYERLPQGVKNMMPSRELCVFCAAVHDIGKASPVFQAHINYGKGHNQPRHWMISYKILIDSGFDETICQVVAAHHGTPPESKILNAIRSGAYNDECGTESEEYALVQAELLNSAIMISGIDLSARRHKLEKYQQMLLAGFVILCDWQASSEETPEFNAAPAFIDPNMETLFEERFHQSPRPIQSSVIDIFNSCNKPGLMIIEAPMGEGKTEAALAAVELMAVRSQRSGLFFALPTQATSNAMFSRVRKWIDAAGLDDVCTIDLLHGKKQANPEFRNLAVYGEEDSNIVVHSWLKGRKKALLADFLIGTVDHLLMAALKQKHVMLRHLALAEKVIVIDECHAYDAYMDTYLNRALNWLGKYSVPVIILSATLTMKKRKELIEAYLRVDHEKVAGQFQNPSAYPLITYTDGDEIHEIPVSGCSKDRAIKIQWINENDIVTLLKNNLSEGGYAGIIVNTVRRSQEIYESIKSAGMETLLIHSRFTAEDRSRLESKVLGILGVEGKREGRFVVVGTQVLEQSLDIDFDMLITDLCPMDLLIQRMGRLHRHRRPVPDKMKNPICYILDNVALIKSDKKERIYSEYILERTRHLIPEMIKLPEDISPLINSIYDGSDGPGKSDYDFMISDKQNRAGSFRLPGPDGGYPSIVGLLQHAASDTDKAAEASVRDGEDVIEVVIINDAERQGGIKLNYIDTINRSVRLPFFFKGDAISELEKNYKDDFKNLYLILGADGTTELCGYRIRYTQEKGLEYERIQSTR